MYFQLPLSIPVYSMCCCRRSSGKCLNPGTVIKTHSNRGEMEEDEAAEEADEGDGEGGGRWNGMDHRECDADGEGPEH